MTILWASRKEVSEGDLEGIAAKATDEQIDYWLGRARRVILAEVPDIAQRVEGGRVAAETVADIQVDLALAKLANPRGIRTIQQTDGPTSGSVTFGGDTPGAMVLTSKQLRDLGGRPPRARSARTVNTW